MFAFRENIGGQQRKRNTEVDLMEASETRRRNLEYLVAKAGSPADLARKSPFSPSYISVVLRGAMSGRGKPRQMGASMARKAEAAMGLERGWFDVPHPELWGSSPVPIKQEVAEILPRTIERRYMGSDMAPEIMQGDTIVINQSIPLSQSGIKITAWETANGLMIGRYASEGEREFLYLADGTRADITANEKTYLGCVTQAMRYY